VHLLFSKPWTEDALLIPAGAKSQYYFVWPHPVGTLVGTTDTVTGRLESEPIPKKEEISEILARIARDIPGAGLGRENLVHAYAGIRNLPLRKSVQKGSSVRLSRKHEWCASEERLLTLLGGKFTSAAWTAAQGLGIFWEETRRKGALPHFSGALSRADISALAASQVNAFARAHGFSEEEQLRLIQRYGDSLERLDGQDDFSKISGSDVLRKLDLKLAFLEEQAFGIDDFLSRRVQREYFPGHELSLISELEAQLQAWGIPFDISQSEKYKMRVHEIDTLCKATGD
jgi:glycerol-3-phosphate dehydrogenase